MLNTSAQAPAEFLSWEQLPELEQLQTIYSDAHKDAYGFRPGPSGGVHCPVTVEDHNLAISKCSDEIGQNQEEDRVLSLRMQRDFEESITELMEVGAPDRITAIRWWFAANGYEPSPADIGFPAWDQQNAEAVLYGLGYPFEAWEFILPEFCGPTYSPHY